MYAQQVEDLEGLKAKITNGLKARKEQGNRQAQRRQVSEAISSKVDFADP